MKFKIDNIIVNDYNSAFEVIKDKIRAKLHEINKAEILNLISEKPHRYQYLTDGITVTIESIISDHLNDLDDNSVAATLTFAFKGEKPYVYKIIKNPKEKKEK